MMLKPESLVGRQIDQFMLSQYVARGAMGLVFKAFDTVLVRTVALKLIPKLVEDGLTEEKLSDREEARKRLFIEAKAAGRLTHPNIVTIHSYGETDEFEYICMEYVGGKTLFQVIKESKIISIEEAVPIVEQILLALVAANQEHIVHRDIKPSNVIITADNRVKVMDFGIAKLPSLSMTLTGVILGTPFYMSPEQISGQNVDIRSDLFSVGALFYEMVTGERPFQSENTTTLAYKIVQVEPIPPRVLSLHIPDTIGNIILHALSKNPQRRYQTPFEMLSDLQAVVGEHLTPATALLPPSAPKTEQSDRESPSSGEITKVQRNVKKTLEEKPTARLSAQPSQKVKNKKSPTAKATDLKRTAIHGALLIVSVLVLVAISGIFLLFRGMSSPPQDASQTSRAKQNITTSLTQPQLAATIQNAQETPSAAVHQNTPPFQAAAGSAEGQKVEKAGNVMIYGEVLSMLTALGLNATVAEMSLWTDHNQFFIGDRIHYYFKVDKDCYVVIICITTDGKVVQLFPNRYQSKSQVHAGQTYTIVDDNAEMALEVSGPVGREEVIAFFSEQPFELFSTDFSHQPFIELSNNSDRLKKISSRIQAAQQLNISQKRIQYQIIGK
jgi:serine/threonine-protein kinase